MEAVAAAGAGVVLAGHPGVGGEQGALGPVHVAEDGAALRAAGGAVQFGGGVLRAAVAVGAEQEVDALPVGDLGGQVQHDAGLVGVRHAGLEDHGPGGHGQGGDHEEARAKKCSLQRFHAVR